MTGLVRFSSINDNADAVKAMVSVPWRITKPSYWSYLSAMILTSCDHSLGDMSLESIGGVNW